MDRSNDDDVDVVGRSEDRMANINGNTDSGCDLNFNPNCGANCVSKLDWVVHFDRAYLAIMIWFGWGNVVVADDVLADDDVSDDDVKNNSINVDLIPSSLSCVVVVAAKDKAAKIIDGPKL